MLKNKRIWKSKDKTFRMNKHSLTCRNSHMKVYKKDLLKLQIISCLCFKTFTKSEQDYIVILRWNTIRISQQPDDTLSTSCSNQRKKNPILYTMICKYEWKMWMGQIHHKTPIKECGRPSPFNQGVPCGADQTMEQADWKFKDHLMENKESYQ